MRFDYNYCLNAELKLFRERRASGNRQTSKTIFGLQTLRRRDGTNRGIAKPFGVDYPSSSAVPISLHFHLQTAPASVTALADTLIFNEEKNTRIEGP